MTMKQFGLCNSGMLRTGATYCFTSFAMTGDVRHDGEMFASVNRQNGFLIE